VRKQDEMQIHNNVWCVCVPLFFFRMHVQTVIYSSQ
jgi:hypothetical protein